ncbi:MAG: hypothetical protein MI976_00850, partial [Pseudomonadales bacterium]|nr:hypothetical protein [Pseudomonadales bacterium]
MGYYILQQDRRILEQAFVLDTPKDFDPLVWMMGKMMPAPTVRKLPLSLNSGKFRGAIIGGVVTLFHQRFIDELNLLNVDNLQYFPIGLENPNGDIDDRYSLVNVVGLLE